MIIVTHNESDNLVVAKKLSNKALLIIYFNLFP